MTSLSFQTLGKFVFKYGTYFDADEQCTVRPTYISLLPTLERSQENISACKQGNLLLLYSYSIDNYILQYLYTTYHAL